MFLYSGFESVNSLSDIENGIYRCECSIYENSKSSLKVMFLEYTLGNAEAVCVVEVVVSGKDGLLKFGDFVKLPDRSWRNSSGVKSDSLQDLLPLEIQSCRFVEKTVMEVENVI